MTRELPLPKAPRERRQRESPRDSRRRWVVNPEKLAYLVGIGVYLPEEDWQKKLPVGKTALEEGRNTDPIPFVRPPAK